MGFFDKGADKARARQKDSVLEEAAAAGSQLVEIVDSSEQASAGSIVGSILKSYVGGRVKHDTFQVFVFRNKELTHLYVQPWEGLVPQPGEHHVRLEGTLPSPAVLRKKFLGRLKWETEGANDALLTQLHQNAGLGSAVKALKWDWKAGLTEIELSWAVQVRSLGGGQSHLVMQAGRYGGFTSYKVGFAPFIRLVSAVRSTLGPTADLATQQFVEPSVYASVFEQYVQAQPTA